MPQFSIVMANYNNGSYIRDSIQSVLAQTFSDWELIIVDDGSIDNSVSLIKQYLYDKRVRLYSRGKNSGYTKSLIFGLRKVAANIVGILDSDDALVVNAIEKVHGVHVENPDVGLVLTQAIICDAALKPLYNTTNTTAHLADPMLWLRGTTHFRTFKTAAYAASLGLSKEFSIASDWDLIIKLEEVAPTYRIDEPLYIHRQLPASISHGALGYSRGYSELCLVVYYAYLRRRRTALPNLPSAVVSAWTISAVRYCMELGQWSCGFAFALRALRISPFALASFRAIGLVARRSWQAVSLGHIKSKERYFLPIHRLQSNTGNIACDHVECIPAVHKTAHALFGGDHLVFVDGLYRAIFQLHFRAESFAQDPLITLDVYENLQTKSILAQRSIYRSEGGSRFREFTVQFEAKQGQRLEFRVHWCGQCYLQIYGVVLERVDGVDVE